MGIHRPNVYGDTLQWMFSYSSEDNTQTLPPEMNTPIQLLRTTGLANGENKNMPIDSNGVITAKVKGKFMLQYHCSFSGGVNKDYTMYWKIGSSLLSTSSTKWTMKGGDVWAISNQTIMEIKEGDTIDLWIENNTDGANVTLSNYNLTIFKIW